MICRIHRASANRLLQALLLNGELLSLSSLLIILVVVIFATVASIAFLVRIVPFAVKLLLVGLPLLDFSIIGQECKLVFPSAFHQRLS